MSRKIRDTSNTYEMSKGTSRKGATVSSEGLRVLRSYLHECYTNVYVSESGKVFGTPKSERGATGKDYIGEVKDLLSEAMEDYYSEKY